ncbi:ATP-binding protein [Shewanella sp. NKUCC06_TVS]|uniref:ATP-binding protein n=1 Tax=Shewanella sp. NKUCC06_TVS TaxID=2842128 RepID=UPI001C5BF6B0|nr:ATP-binding protein [Shewanella sp. NKUCC06_TVS]MBW3533261.1 ATP-binding protein [Shewanella sp. NKUCC06_TVS]
MSEKVAIIMRGLPGSGKSHWVEAYILSLPLEKAICVRQRGVFSTDSFFYHEDEYRFDAKKLPEFHQCNLTGFIQALSSSEPVVICDNTNLCHWEYMAYEAAAKALGYQVRIVLVGEPSSLAHQQECATRNRHGVPLAQIQRMAKGFEDF